ncbi:hypothetical protein LDENG_00152990 [Lucifuga dentata]|nr:hypothetical protein LDENG_00152990 [Lucifuga dentata]
MALPMEAGDHHHAGPEPSHSTTDVQADQYTHTTNISITSIIDFDNPYKVGRCTNINEESLYVNISNGVKSFLSLSELKDRDFLKGGTATFLFSVQDISSLKYESSLSCPDILPSKLNTYSNSDDQGPCYKWLDTKSE